MTLDVSPDTQVRVGASEGTLDDVKQGENARVAYQLSAPRPRALTIEVLQAGASGSAGSQQPGASSAQDAGASGSSTGSIGSTGSGAGAADQGGTCDCGQQQGGTSGTPGQ